MTLFEANQTTATNDCHNVEICVNGELVEMTLFEANQTTDTADCEETQICVNGNLGSPRGNVS